MAVTEPVSLSKDTQEKIDLWLEKYPVDQRQSAVIPALHLVQEEQGHLSEEAMDAVAAYLGMPKIAVYEVATFYSMFDLDPRGKHKINVCGSISCWLRGSDKLLAHLKEKLGVGIGETTADGKFTINKVECLAACSNAPASLIGKDYHENLTTKKIDQIIEELQQHD